MKTDIKIGPYIEKKISKEGCTAMQMVIIGNKRFKLHSKTSSSSCSGFDSDLCVKAVLDDGRLVPVFDSREVNAFKNGNYCRSIEERRAFTKRAFSLFVQHLKDIYIGE